MDFKGAYDLFMSNLGYDSQVMICIEEMSELTKELCKFSRYGNNIDNIREELADVFNCVEQLSYHFGYDEIQKIREFKINRALDKINKK